MYSKKAISTPEDVIEVIGEELQKYDRELFCILNLRTKNQVINMNIVSMGSLNAVFVEPREVYKSAILANAAGVLLIHNHPSGDPSPSREDINITKRLEECGALLGIPVVDHIIFGIDKMYSFKRNSRINYKNYSCVAEKPLVQEKSR